MNATAPGTVDTADAAQDRRQFAGGGAGPSCGAYVERSYPLGRIGRTDDIAGIAVYLASGEAAWTSGLIFVDRRGLHRRVNGPSDVARRAFACGLR